MYLKAIISTLAAWFVGLLIDVNLGSGDWQIPVSYTHLTLPTT